MEHVWPFFQPPKSFFTTFPDFINNFLATLSDPTHYPALNLIHFYFEVSIFLSVRHFCFTSYLLLNNKSHLKVSNFIFSWFFGSSIWSGHSLQDKDDVSLCNKLFYEVFWSLLRLFTQLQYLAVSLGLDGLGSLRTHVWWLVLAINSHYLSS